MAKQLNAVQSLYDRWAAVYDWNPILRLVRPARRRVVEAMNLSPGDTVVDMGTGTGANLPLLREAVGPTGTVVGLDASTRMLDRARVRVAKEGWDNVTLLKGDIRDPPLERPIDGICSTFVAVMYEAPRTLFGPWAELVDGGSIGNLYAGPSQRRYAPAVNTLLRVYLWLFERGWTVDTDLPAIEILARRGEEVRTAMTDLADSMGHEEHVFGLVKLDVGQF